jgi:peptidoglycan/LPS O-acetylase OafA/YrhL
MPSRFRHFPQLDGWRGISIILVLIGHTLAYSLCLPAPFNRIDEFATLGVLCFFILSGFLITGLLLEEEKVSSTISLTRFYCRRVLRIIPAYYLFIAAVALLMLANLVTDVPWFTVAICLLFLRDLAGRSITLGHTWSLSLEEQFYLIWPFLLSKLPGNKRITSVLGVCLAIATWRFFAINIGIWHPYNSFRPDFRFDCILAGCLLALLHQNSVSTGTETKTGTGTEIRSDSGSGSASGSAHRVQNGDPDPRQSTDNAPRRERRHPAGIGSPVLLLIPLILVWTLFTAGTTWALPIYLTVQLWLAALLFWYLLVQENSWFARALSHPVLRWFGKISYSLYLWQQLFIAMKIPSWGIIRTFPFDLLCALAVSCLSYYLVERPFLKLKKKFQTS